MRPDTVGTVTYNYSFGTEGWTLGKDNLTVFFSPRISEPGLIRDSAILVATRASSGAVTTLRVQGRPRNDWLASRNPSWVLDV